MFGYVCKTDVLKHLLGVATADVEVGEDPLLREQEREEEEEGEAGDEEDKPPVRKLSASSHISVKEAYAAIADQRVDLIPSVHSLPRFSVSISSTLPRVIQCLLHCRECPVQDADGSLYGTISLLDMAGFLQRNITKHGLQYFAHAHLFEEQQLNLGEAYVLNSSLSLFSAVQTMVERGSPYVAVRSFTGSDSIVRCLSSPHLRLDDILSKDDSLTSPVWGLLVS